MFNYRTANCPRIAAPFYVGVECPAAIFYISAQPRPSIFGWLFTTHSLLVINGELGQFALRPEPPAFCVAALPLLSLPCLTSIIHIYVLHALYRIRAQLPARRLKHRFLTRNSDPELRPGARNSLRPGTSTHRPGHGAPFPGAFLQPP